MQSVSSPQVVSVNNSYTINKLPTQSAQPNFDSSGQQVWQLPPGIYDIDKTFIYRPRVFTAILNSIVQIYHRKDCDLECQGQLQLTWDGTPVGTIQNLTLQQFAWYQTQNRMEIENSKNVLQTGNSVSATAIAGVVNFNGYDANTGLNHLPPIPMKQCGVVENGAANLKTCQAAIRYSLRHWLGGYFPDNFKYLVVTSSFTITQTKSPSNANIYYKQTLMTAAQGIVVATAGTAPAIQQGVHVGSSANAVSGDYIFTCSLNYTPAAELMFPTKPILQQTIYQNMASISNQQPVPIGTVCREQYITFTQTAPIGGLVFESLTTYDIAASNNFSGSSYVSSFLKNNQQQMFCSNQNEFFGVLQEMNGNNVKYDSCLSFKQLWPLDSGFITNTITISSDGANNPKYLDVYLSFLSY